MNKKIVFVVNVDWFFMSHRFPLALEALKESYEVYLLTKDTGFRAEREGVFIKICNIKNI